MPPKGYKKPIERCLWEKVEKTATCWLWQGETARNGYGTIKDLHTQKRQLVHRVAYRLCVGVIGEGQVVRHRCDVRNCVNPDHLELGTQADNVADMIARGRHIEGQRQRVLKLTGRKRGNNND